jgi:hypothetical protein
MILRLGVIALAFLIAAIAMLPLRMAWAVAPASTDVSVAHIDGTVWDGHIAGVRWRGHALGDFDTSISPADFLPQPGLLLSGGTGPLRSAMLRSGGDALTISRADIRVDLASLAPALSTSAVVSISHGQITLQRNTCLSASGQIDVPPTEQIGLPAFTGTLACDGGTLLAQLSSAAGDVVLELNGASHVSWRSASPALAAMLVGAGIPKSAAAES